MWKTYLNEDRKYPHHLQFPQYSPLQWTEDFFLPVLSRGLQVQSFSFLPHSVLHPSRFVMFAFYIVRTFISRNFFLCRPQIYEPPQQQFAQAMSRCCWVIFDPFKNPNKTALFLSISSLKIATLLLEKFFDLVLTLKNLLLLFNYLLFLP